VKAQLLVDVLIELPKLKERHDLRSLIVNRLSNKKDSGIGIILEGLVNIILEQAIHFTFDAFNN